MSQKKESGVIQIDVTIMEQSYKLACKEGEDLALRAAAAYLNEKMCAIRDAGRVRGTDRIAVMAALGVAAELLSVKAPDGPWAGWSMAQVRQCMVAMNETLDAALTPQENLF